MQRKNLWQNLPIFLSLVLALLAVPLTLAAVRVNQDIRSEAMVKKAPLPTIPPIKPVITSPVPSPILSPLPY